MDINKIIALSELAKKQGKETNKKRELFSQIFNHQDKTLLGLIGARGTGKTVLLKQCHAKDEDSIYITLDSLEADADIFALLKTLNEDYNFNKFYFDEIHYNETIEKSLKNAFDFLNIQLTFTSSVSISLIQSAYDLSRRVKLIKFLPFSYSEYLDFNKLATLPKLTLDEILKRKYTSKHTATTQYLKNYLLGYNYPFSLEVKDVKTALANNLKKIVNSDIPKSHKLTIQELDVILKLIRYISKCPVSDINPTNIAKNLKITAYKANQYLELLEQAFIVKKVMPWGTNVLKEPKVLMCLPYRALELEYEKAIGGLREDFAVDCLSRANINFHYLKTKRGQKTPDLILEHKGKKLIIEIGGEGKNFSQFKDINEDVEQFIFSDSSNSKVGYLPLVLLGFLAN